MENSPKFLQFIIHKEAEQMIPIYICDDQQIYQEQIKDILEKYIFIEDNSYEIKLVTDKPTLLLDELSHQIQRGVYFLDVEILGSEYDGFTLAQEIRKLDTRGFIVFITSHEELAFETFRYRLEALDYIVKDDTQRIQQRIYDCMRSISRRMNEEREVSIDYFPVKIGSEIQHVPYQDILFFETSPQKHRILLHTETMMLEFFGKLQEIEEMLPTYFMRSHRSYIVNTRKIATIDSKNSLVILKTKHECPIARNMKAAFKSLHIE